MIPLVYINIRNLEQWTAIITCKMVSFSLIYHVFWTLKQPITIYVRG